MQHGFVESSPSTAAKWALVVGNISTGFSFQGPFEWAEDAIEYADQMIPHGAWFIVPIEPIIKH